jgi:branched-chain amino acid transport system permease protein
VTRPQALAACLVGLTILLLGLLPFTANNYTLRLATMGFMYVTLASSWNLVGGFLGYPSFATAAFVGLGAYGGAILRASIHLPLPLTWIAGSITAGAFALVIGPAILRLRGHYFAVASVVLAAALREVVNGATGLTGGGMGLNLPAPTGIDVDAQSRLYYASMLCAAGITVGASYLISRSRIGWAMRCIAQNEDAAIVLGVNTLAAKIAGLVASALAAGLAGAIYATWIGYIDPTDVFDDLLSIKPIVMAFLVGVGTVAGPAAGALIFLASEEFVWRNVLNFHAGILGILIVALLVFLPTYRGGLSRRIPGLSRVMGSRRTVKGTPASMTGP